MSGPLTEAIEREAARLMEEFGIDHDRAIELAAPRIAFQAAIARSENEEEPDDDGS